MERGAKKPVVQAVVGHLVWRVLMSLLYITGLTLLIPFIFLFVFPEDSGVVAPVSSPILVWTAVVMVVISVLVTLAYRKSFGAALKSLGRITFIPGFIGLVFSIFGRDAVLLYLAGTVSGFQKVQNLLTLYVDNAVPKVRYLTLGFFVLGIVLWLMGDKLETDAAIYKARVSFGKLH
jgi:hypothetical protein